MFARRHFRLFPGRRQAGFSLIEVLTALIIFSIAIVGFIQNLGVTMAIQSDMIDRQRAAMLAENVLEEIKLAGPSEEGEENGTFEDDDAGFAWRSKTEETKTQDLVEITVSVSWNSGHGDKDYSLSTLMAR